MSGGAPAGAVKLPEERARSSKKTFNKVRV